MNLSTSLCCPFSTALMLFDTFKFSRLDSKLSRVLAFFRVCRRFRSLDLVMTSHGRRDRPLPRRHVGQVGRGRAIHRLAQVRGAGAMSTSRRARSVWFPSIHFSARALLGGVQWCVAHCGLLFLHFRPRDGLTAISAPSARFAGVQFDQC